MAYKTPINQWIDLIPVVIIPRNENTQVRVSVVYKEDEPEKQFLSLREFAKYLKKEERAAGLTLDDAIFRPTNGNGVTIPLDKVEALTKAMNKAAKEARAELGDM